MAKGLFTQSACLLTNGQTTIDHVKETLQSNGFEIAKENTSPPDEWRFSGPAVVVPFLPVINGYVAIDVVNHRWPDLMGDPKTDPLTFGAWAMGQFGPLVFPGNLQRSQQNAWAWPEGRTLPDQHSGFIRIRMSYIFGAKSDLVCIPKNYAPLDEIVFLSRLVLALFDAPGVLCYFNPNGEVLYNRHGFARVWDGCQQEKKLPLQLWMNVRLFNLNETLLLMDTVGNKQLEIADAEAIFPKSKYSANDVAYYLRNVTHYLLGIKREIKTGESIDGPGDGNLSWAIERVEQAVVHPPRSMMRLYPKANQKEVQSAIPPISRPPS